jgi:medium-chain acyl-[acyl-carrier-protein] hydrolase
MTGLDFARSTRGPGPSTDLTGTEVLRTRAYSRKWLPYAEERSLASYRLFCLPFAGGGASSFIDLRRNAPSWLNVLPVQLPGRENRISEPPLNDLREIVSGLVKALLPWLDQPYGLLGYSLGARIARALVAELQSKALPLPSALLVAAHRAPNFPAQHPPLNALPSDEFWARVTAYNGTPTEVLANRELRNLLEPMLRADFAMAEAPVRSLQTPLSCPIVALAGTTDPFAGPQAMGGWAVETRGEFELLTIKGAHFFLRTNPHSFMEQVFSSVLKMTVPLRVQAA